MEITGILVKKVGEREGVSQRNGLPWKTAEFLVEVPGQYARHTSFSVNDGQVGRIARFESLIGKTVTVSFDIDAHEYQGRWYNSIRAWNVDRNISDPMAQAPVVAQIPNVAPFDAPQAAPLGTAAPVDAAPFASMGAEDLPF